MYPPHPALQDTVSHIMVFEADLSDAGPRVAPFPPTPQHCINFYPRDANFVQFRHDGPFVLSADSIVVGPQVSRVNLLLGKRHCIVSACFRPGGLYRLLGIPLHEMYDRSFDATQLFGKDIALVNQRLKECVTHTEMRDIVEGFLIRKAQVRAGHAPFEKTMQLMLQSAGAMSMDRAASLACLSLRQFERKAKDMLGYSPKMFARVTRFSYAYRMKEKLPGMSWTQLAAACGYFDQMHLIHDFQEFAGVSPTAILDDIRRSPFAIQQTLNL